MIKGNSSLFSSGFLYGAACAALLMVWAPIGWAQGLPTGNLIANSGADAGTASADGRAMVGSIPGWTRTGNTNVLPYDLPGYVLLKDPAPPDHSFQYFYAGNAGAGASSL